MVGNGSMIRVVGKGSAQTRHATASSTWGVTAFPVNPRQLGFEKALFDRFCATTRFKWVAGSIRQPSASPGTIVVDVHGAPSMNFQLVSLDDIPYLTRQDLMPRWKQRLVDHVAALAPDIREAFESRFCDAFISILFDSLDGPRSIRQSLTALFRRLMSLPPNFSGPCEYYSAAAIPGVRKLYIARDVNLQGPQFTTPDGERKVPMDLTRLKLKLTAGNPVTSPCDLLAYTLMTSRLHDEDEVAGVLQAHFPPSPYRRAWFFEDPKGKVTAYER